MDQIVADFDYEGFARRAKEAIFPEKVTAFAARINMQHGTVSKVLNAGGSIAPRLDIAAKIAEGAGVTLDWLVYGRGDGPETGSALRIPRYDVQLAAGAGAWNEGRRHLEDIPLPAAVLEQQFGRRSSAGLTVLTARGDSMEPTIQDRGLVLVDETVTDWFDGVFAFVFAGEARVKRFRRMMDGLQLISDNGDYPPEVVQGSDMNKLQIIGQVLGVLQRI